MKTAMAGVLRRGWRPLAWYYAIAVGVPVLNGAPLDAGFLEHVAFVLAVPLLIVVAAGFVARLGWRSSRGRQSAA